jgi:hypothetical protein
MQDMAQCLTATAVLLILFCYPATSQCVSGEKAPVESRKRQILAPDGKAVRGADVTVVDASGKALFRTHSDAHGKFSVPRLTNDNQWLYDKDFHVRISAPGFIRYQYVLLQTGDSRKVQPLTLVPTSKCNDVKIETDPPS